MSRWNSQSPITFGWLPDELSKPANCNADFVNDPCDKWCYDHHQAFQRMRTFVYDYKVFLRRCSPGPDHDRIQAKLSSVLRTIQALWKASGGAGPNS